MKRIISKIGKYKENEGLGEFELEYSNDFGKFKSKHWEFQKESRFIIRVLPIKYPSFIPHNEMNSIFFLFNEIFNSIGTLISENQSVSVEYFDINLNNDAFENIEILLGPQTTEAEEIAVQSLIRKYCPSAKMNKSMLAGKIRSKGIYL